MKFVADRMLGRLAKWLRLLGYDTVFEKDIGDDALLALLKALPERTLLTRHRSIMKRVAPERSLFVTEDRTDAQLSQVVKQLELKPDASVFFTRCSRCNGALARVGPEAVAGRVPEYVWQTQRSFSVCRDCGKIYWPGTHIARFRDHLEAWLGEEWGESAGNPSPARG